VLKLVFAALVLAPLIGLAVLVARLEESEREALRHRFDELLAARLSDSETPISRVVERYERELDRITDLGSRSAEKIRERVRRERVVRQIFVLDSSSRPLHPPPEGPRTRAEDDFVERTSFIWDSGEKFVRADDGADERGGDGGPAISDESGWYTWYRDSGVNFIFWRRARDGALIGVEVDRVPLLSDIIAELPSGESSLPGRIRLVDSAGETLYGWGGAEPADDREPRVSRALSPPLGAWKLEYVTAPDQLDHALEDGATAGTVAAAASLGLVVALLAGWFLWASGREVREARRRVTFVNQVSHELKTPLTNIRMYAELLEDRVDEEDERAGGYLSVIVDESRRLSRLIANVLSFARKQRGKLAVRPKPRVPDEVIAQVIEQFRPGLASSGLAVEVDLNASEPALLDSDAFEQILGNLLSNVEKYAADGGHVAVSSYSRADRLVVEVADRGPGIPAAARRKVFEPFYRTSSRVTDGVAGTGIGLPIARELARLHGGVLTLEPSQAGARFRVELEAPRIEGDER
jgi:signal transduction histidine kinase